MIQMLLDETEKQLLENTEALKNFVKDYLSFIYENAEEDDTFEVRILYIDNKPATTWFFDVKDLDKAVDYIVKKTKSEDNIKGIYVTINTGKGALAGAYNDDAIFKVINLPLDIDAFHAEVPGDMELSAVREAVKKAAEELFGKMGIRYMITESGFGFHVYVKLKPLLMDKIMNWREWKTAYAEVAKDMAEEFEKEMKKHIEKRYVHLVENSVDKQIYNLSRIMRVAWTLNRRKINNIIYVKLSKKVVVAGSTELDLSEKIEEKMRELAMNSSMLKIENKNNITLNQQEKETVVSILKKYYVVGKRHNIALGWAAFAWHRGITLADAEEVIMRVASETHDEEVEDRITAVEDTYDAELKNYKSYLDENIVYELNEALKNYYKRAMKRQKINVNVRAFTTAENILSGKFRLSEWLKERTVEIIKEKYEKNSDVVFKVTFFLEVPGKTEEIVLKDVDRLEKYKIFIKLNEDFMKNFSIYIVNPLSIQSLDRDEKKKFFGVVSNEMLDYYAYVTQNAREVFVEEDAEVKESFFDTIETMVKGIVKIDERSSLSRRQLAYLLKNRYMIYAINEDAVYVIDSLLRDEDVRGFTKKLSKIFAKRGIIEKNLRSVRTSTTDDEGRRINYYRLNADNLFTWLGKEKVILPQEVQLEDIIEIKGVEEEEFEVV